MAVTGDPSSLWRGPSGRARRLVGVGAVLGVLCIGVVVARPARPDDEPAPTPSTADPVALPVRPTTLDATGAAPVSLGMTAAAYRKLYSDSSGWDVHLTATSTPGTPGCIRYQPEQDDRREATTWAWVLDDRVVSVGISSGPATTAGTLAAESTTTTVGTAFGVPLGSPLDAPVVESLGPGWSRETALPFAAYLYVDPPRERSDTPPPVTMTLADTDSDGRLDFATVELSAAAGCALDMVAVGS